ncbi:GH12 family glycosyl hydrolase domain-containing protein [Streptomyces sp. 4N509B]|uniref:GH12 family glycosyl hydrolase domain-containing protein n=1 Tax=Streptomyces sp. 4N509B TaxID=3457413 RepID=UPI003FD2464F
MRRRRVLTLILAPVVALLTVVGYTASTAQAQVWESCEQWGEYHSPEGYIVYNNIWGSGAGSQCVSADSGTRFTVSADHPNTGGIKSYPNSKWVVGEPINAIDTLTTSYDVSVPQAGAYNTTYDIWDVNYDHEIMIWLNWYGPVGPLGSPVGTATLGGHTWDVYHGHNGGNYVYSFLRQGNSSQGTVDTVPILDYVVDQGWMSSSDVIGDVQLGFEITSSAGGLDFRVNDYSVTAN